MTIYDFIYMATDDFYKINIYDIEKGTEILHQVELSQIEKQAEEKGINNILDKQIASWDIDDFSKDFTINVE
jgi:hypothetical protein